MRVNFFQRYYIMTAHSDIHDIREDMSNLWMASEHRGHVEKRFGGI